MFDGKSSSSLSYLYLILILLVGNHLCSTEYSLQVSQDSYDDDCSNCQGIPCFCVLDRDYVSSSLACFTPKAEDVRFQVEENGESIYLTSAFLRWRPDYSTSLTNSSLIILEISNVQNHNGSFYRCRNFYTGYESHRFQLILSKGPESEVGIVTPFPAQHPPATPCLGDEQAGLKFQSVCFSNTTKETIVTMVTTNFTNCADQSLTSFPLLLILELSNGSQYGLHNRSRTCNRTMPGNNAPMALNFYVNHNCLDSTTVETKLTLQNFPETVNMCSAIVCAMLLARPDVCTNITCSDDEQIKTTDGDECPGDGSQFPASPPSESVERVDLRVIVTVFAVFGAVLTMLCSGSVCVIVLHLAVRRIRMRKKLSVQQPSDTPANQVNSDYMNIDDDLIMGRSQERAFAEQVRSGIPSHGQPSPGFPCIFETTQVTGNTLKLKPLSYPVNALPTERLQTDADTLLHENIQLTESPAYVCLDDLPKDLQRTQQDQDALTETPQNSTWSNTMKIESNISYPEHSHPAVIMQTTLLNRDAGYTMESFSYPESMLSNEFVQTDAQILGHEDIPMTESPAYVLSYDCQKDYNYPQQDS